MSYASATRPDDRREVWSLLGRITTKWTRRGDALVVDEEMAFLLLSERRRSAQPVGMAVELVFR